MSQSDLLKLIRKWCDEYRTGPSGYPIHDIPLTANEMKSLAKYLYDRMAN